MKKTENKVVIMRAEELAYNAVFSNMKRVGTKSYACIPLDMLYVDDSYQRVEMASKRKIKELADKWMPEKMDALLVVPHPEKKKFVIVNGYHRFEAAKILEKRGKGIIGLECDIVLNLSEDPEERRIQEAKLFVSQEDEVDKLTPLQKHKASIVCGEQGNIVVQKVVDKYGIKLKKPTGRGLAKIGHLAGFTAALRVATVGGEQMLDDIFDVLMKSRWNLDKRGFGAQSIKSVYNVLKLHPEHRTEVKEEIVKYLLPIQPSQFFANAAAAYPERTTDERQTIHLEDVVCEALGIERVYQKGKTKKEEKGLDVKKVS